MIQPYKLILRINGTHYFMLWIYINATDIDGNFTVGHALRFDYFISYFAVIYAKYYALYSSL